MDTIYKAPDWLYKPANIDSTKLKTIQYELLKLSKKVIVNMTTAPSEFRVVADRELIKEFCPVYMEELKKLGLADMIMFLALISVRSGSFFPIHIDYPDPRRLSFGLNIPVLNCQDSYTVWYDAEPLPYKILPAHIVTSELVSTAIPVVEETAVEIARCDANVPHWINNYAPHKPICLHDNYRINSSMRFMPEIYEMIADGYFEKHLVKHD
jgi:hypothetical protein